MSKMPEIGDRIQLTSDIPNHYYFNGDKTGRNGPPIPEGSRGTVIELREDEDYVVLVAFDAGIEDANRNKLHHVEVFDGEMRVLGILELLAESSL